MARLGSAPGRPAAHNPYDRIKSYSKRVDRENPVAFAL